MGKLYNGSTSLNQCNDLTIFHGLLSPWEPAFRKGQQNFKQIGTLLSTSLPNDTNCNYKKKISVTVKHTQLMDWVDFYHLTVLTKFVRQTLLIWEWIELLITNGIRRQILFRLFLFYWEWMKRGCPASWSSSSFFNGSDFQRKLWKCALGKFFWRLGECPKNRTLPKNCTLLK